MKIIILILSLFICANIYSQSAFEPVDSDVYDFLERLSIKGKISFDYEIKPVTRIEIANKLLKLDENKTALTAIDKELLNFYKEDFLPEIRIIKKEFNGDSKPEFFITEKNKRIRLFEYASNVFSFYADPLVSLSAESISAERLFVRRNGFNIYGYASGNWAYALSFFDNEESGDNLDPDKDISPERGTSITKLKNKAFEYDAVTASAVYYWSTGSISLGKEYFKIGSARLGNVILSDKAPSFPFLRLDFKPVDWLRFFYFHGFLVSNVLDSSSLRFSEVPGRQAIADVPKFIALHSLSFYPNNNFSFTLGESIIYSDNLQPVYFIPIMFFRAADHYLSRGNNSSTGNAQLFADASYINPSLRSKLYGSLFIDELSLNSLFEGGNLSAIGYTFGIESSDLFLSNSTINLEYTRTNPFVYMNSVSSQSFANDDYNLGHWIGSNGDILSITYSQYLMRPLLLSLKTWYIRKGKKELPEEQYQTPYPNFLFGAQRSEFSFDIRIKYRPYHPLIAEASYKFARITEELERRTPEFKLGSNHNFGIRVSYGFN